jgi:hypothetical protein
MFNFILDTFWCFGIGSDSRLCQYTSLIYIQVHKIIFMKAVQYSFVLAVILGILILAFLVMISNIIPKEAKALAEEGPSYRPLSEVPGEEVPWEPDPVAIDPEDINEEHTDVCSSDEDWLISEVACLIGDMIYYDFTTHGESDRGEENCITEKASPLGMYTQGVLKICKADEEGEAENEGSKLFKLKSTPSKMVANSHSDAIDFDECLANLQAKNCDWCDGGDGDDTSDELDEVCINYNLKDRVLPPASDFCDGPISVSGDTVRFGNYECVNKGNDAWGDCCDGDKENDEDCDFFTRDFCDNEGSYDDGNDIMLWSATKISGKSAELDTYTASDSYSDTSADFTVAYGKNDYSIKAGDYYIFSLIWVDKISTTKYPNRYILSFAKVPAQQDISDFNAISEDITRVYEIAPLNSIPQYARYNIAGYFQPEARRVKDIMFTPSSDMYINNIKNVILGLNEDFYMDDVPIVSCNGEECMNGNRESLGSVFTPIDEDAIPLGETSIMSSFQFNGIKLQTNMDTDKQLYAGNRYRIIMSNWVGLWKHNTFAGDYRHYTHYDRTIVLYKQPPWIELSKTIGRVGSTITVTGGNFLDSNNNPYAESYDIYFGGEVVASFTPDSKGQFSTTFTVPDKGTGTYIVTIQKPEWPDTEKEFVISASQCVGGYETDEDGITKKCRFGCKDDTFCWEGIKCGQATATCKNCLWGTCGDEQCTNDICWTEDGGSKPIPSDNILCEATCSCVIEGWSKVIANGDCSACTDACSGPISSGRECACGGWNNNCDDDGSIKEGCWMVDCVTDDDCTYE